MTPPSGLVGWWKGDGSTLDSIATNNGVNQNITYTGGVVGQAFACDPENFSYGTYTGIQIADRPAYALTNSLTIEGWVRPRGDGYIIFFRGDHRPGLDPYFLSMNGNSNLDFYITDPAGNYVHVETTLPYFQWTHVAATLDGSSGTMSIYTNGVLAVQTVTTSRPFGDLIPGESPGVGIGNLNDGGNTFPFLGDIDEIGLYDRALSVGEIQAIYNAGSAGKCPATSPPPPAVSLLVNGSFENPPGINPYAVFNTGTSLLGWVVENGTVEIVGTYWQSAEGAQSLDLNGIFEQIGTIYQDFATTPGQTYKVRFAYAGNPECGLPTLKTANVFWDSQTLTNLSFDTTGHTLTNMGWIYYEQIVTATSSNSRIRFQATSPTFCGLTLDDVSVTPTAPQPICTPPPSGLVSWWRAEGNANEIIGGTTGLVYPGTGYANGAVGQAFSFDGVTGCVMNTNTLPMTNIQNSFTMEFWAYPQKGFDMASENDSGYPGISGQSYAIFPDWGGLDGQAGVGVCMGTNGISVIEHAHDYMPSMLSYTNLINGWIHVAVVYVNKQPTLYVNGVNVRTGITSSRSFVYPSKDLGNSYGSVFGHPFNSYGPYQGLLDEVAIYNRALASTEIQSIYNAGSAGKCVAPVAPSITRHPTNQTVMVGDAVTLDVTVTGAAPLSFQWHFNEGDITNATNNALLLSNVQLAQGGVYSVTVSNSFGSVTSSNAVLTVVGVPPTITVQPQDQWVYEGKTVTFRVAATGSAPFWYQWEKNGSPLPNATNAEFTLAKVQFGDAGLYRVTVTNLFDSAISRQATLTVRPAPVCVPAPDGAIAWWPGESNTWDVVSGFDGLFVQPPPPTLAYTTGKVGAALRFVGSPYVQISHGGGLNVGSSGSLTIEGWIRPDVYSVMPVAEWNDGSQFVGAGLLLGSTGPGVIEATLSTTNSPKQIATFRSAPYAVSNLVWQHVALTYAKSNGLATLYVDGRIVAQTNAGIMTPNTSGDVYLGYRRSGSYAGTRFRGALDEFTLYNRALSVAEVQGIVAADEAGKCVPPPPPCVVPPANIAAWWRVESNALDSVAGNHAMVIPTNYPATLTYQTGLVNAAFAFRGQNYLSVPRSDNLDLGKAGGLTIEAWIYPGLPRPMPIVEWTDSNSFGASLWLSYSRGPTVLEANLIDTSGGFHLIQSPTSTLTYNSWQHVALTYDKVSGVAALYVNGNTAVTTNLGSFTPRTDLPLMLGVHPPNLAGSGGIGAAPASSYLFYGAMDEVALYRRALNAVEIRSLARVRPGKCLELPPTIGSQPQDQVALEGGAATLGVVAGGTQPLGYQWFFAGQPIAGAASPSLALAAVKLTDAGAYSVIVSNALGSATSRVATLTVLPANQCLPTPLGAVAFWRGESNTVDELGSHPASWTNTTPGYTSAQTGGGKVGTAFRFNGSSYLQIPANADLNVGAGGGFTVEGWIKPDSLSGQQSLVDWNDGRGNVGVGLLYARTGPGVLEVTLTDTNAASTSEKIFTFATPWYAVGSPTNQVPAWTHVALTFERVSGKASLYVNGKSVAERNVGPVLTYSSPQFQRIPFNPATTGDLFFGWRRSGLYSGTRFRGAMDEMTVYYRALSPLELQAIYVVGANGKCTPQPSCLPLDEGVAGWWRGESNLLDSVNTNHGSVTVGPMAYTNGVAGTALHFPGSGNYVRIPAAPAINVGTGDGLTFEAWVNPSPQNSAYALTEWNSGQGEQGVSFGTSPTRGSFYFEANVVDTTGKSHLLTSPYRAVTNGGWQHVAVTYDKLSGIGVMFVNGGPVTVTNLGLFTPRTTGNLYLGYRPPGNYPGSSWRFIGGMDEVMIHRRALSSGEITAHYRNAANRCMEPPVIVQQPVSQRVNVGSDVTLSVQATGNPVLRYQWFQNGKPLYDRQQQPVPSLPSPVLTLTNVGGWQEGNYQVVVSNAFGLAVSSNAVLLVNFPPVANASNTIPLLISPNGSNVVAVLDGSQSSDPDGDSLTYAWSHTGDVTAFASGVVAVTTLLVGSNQLTLVVNDGMASGSQTFTVEVLTTSEAVDRLMELVQSDVSKANSLLASLRAALASIDRSNPTAAINQLQAFQNQVAAQISPLDPELAQSLIDAAQSIINALSGGGEASNKAVKASSHANGKIHLNFSGMHQQIYIIEASTNLVDWEKIGVAKDQGDGTFDFDDADAVKMSGRFYRVVAP
ncbi:MAG: immunoglobulin domain-containing protein [Verrucomicrobiales bacterium]|nr:immunoglobulin domain-containing protein [Verrucomicrobiales bacterium]